jgi:hypothetical protein
MAVLDVCLDLVDNLARSNTFLCDRTFAYFLSNDI